MPKGDHISVARSGYSHHGIDVGDGTVVHFAGAPGKTKDEAEIRQDTLEDFLKGGTSVIVRHVGPVDADETVRRALSRVGERGYGLLDNNCEHFAHWCVTGDHVSSQVLGGATAAHLGVATYAASRAGLAIVATNGSPGLNGPGIMSGLAATGRNVGGGAATGLFVLGAAPAVVSLFVVGRTFRDEPQFTDREREARSAARSGAWCGAAVGIVAVLAAVYFLGTVRGFSGPGIASGLRALGGAVGGGMAAGTMVVAAIPAATVAATGFTTYRFVGAR